jgi:hypothetical protein
MPDTIRSRWEPLTLSNVTHYDMSSWRRRPMLKNPDISTASALSVQSYVGVPAARVIYQSAGEAHANADIADLAEQLLDTMRNESKEEGIPVPSIAAATNARCLLQKLERIPLPSNPEIYPTPDAEIAIDISGGYRKSVLILCDSSGGALIMLTINGVHRRACYDLAPRVLDGFLRDALRDLHRAKANAA